MPQEELDRIAAISGRDRQPRGDRPAARKFAVFRSAATPDARNKPQTFGCGGLTKLRLIVQGRRQDGAIPQGLVPRPCRRFNLARRRRQQADEAAAVLDLGDIGQGVETRVATPRPTTAPTGSTLEEEASALLRELPAAAKEADVLSLTLIKGGRQRTKSAPVDVWKAHFRWHYPACSCRGRTSTSAARRSTAYRPRFGQCVETDRLLRASVTVLRGESSAGGHGPG